MFAGLAPTDPVSFRQGPAPKHSQGLIFASSIRTKLGPPHLEIFFSLEIFFLPPHPLKTFFSSSNTHPWEYFFLPNTQLGIFSPPTPGNIPPLHTWEYFFSPSPHPLKLFFFPPTHTPGNIFFPPPTHTHLGIYFPPPTHTLGKCDKNTTCPTKSKTVSEPKAQPSIQDSHQSPRQVC